MNNITFEKNAEAQYTKENTEWMRIWCQNTHNSELPRIALIGDSITEGYYNFVESSLKDVANIDYLATSYSVLSDAYFNSVKNFVSDSIYDVVHFNYGLHAYSVDEQSYESKCREIIKFIKSKSKVVVATTTTVLDDKLENENTHWKNTVILRNERIKNIANELNLPINDLNAVCKSFDKTMRENDGVHFTHKGYMILSENVVTCLKKLI